MSRDIEALLRGVAQTPARGTAIAPASDLRRRGDRRRLAARAGAAGAAVAVLALVAAGVGALVPSPSVVPAPTGPASPEPVSELPGFPVPETLHHGSPPVPRTTGTGPDRIAADMAGATTTYFTCVGGGRYTLTFADVTEDPQDDASSSGECEGRVDGSTVTYGAVASRAVIGIDVDPGVRWAIQVVPAKD
jgi:hypothetical protein